MTILDNPEALTALAVKSFAEAKRKAIAENDRLGIPSYGSKDGKIVVRLRGMSLADMLDGYEAGRVSELAAMRWLGVWRYAEFLATLDYNLRPVPRGRLPLWRLRRQMMRRRLAQRRLS